MVRVKTYVELWEYVEHSDCVLIEKFKGGRYVNVIFKGNKRHKKRAQLKAPLYLESYVMVIPPLEQENKELSKTPTNTTKVQICPECKGTGTNPHEHEEGWYLHCEECGGTGKL